MYCELASYILPPLFLKKIFFHTFRELGTSNFALNNINKRKHGVSKLGFISCDYAFRNVKSNWEFCSTFISLIEIVEQKKQKFPFILLPFVFFSNQTSAKSV